MGVLGPGRCLYGFVRHFSSRYTPSDPKISILDPKSFKFYRKSGPQVFLKIDAVNRDRAVPRLRFELSGSPRRLHLNRLMVPVSMRILSRKTPDACGSIM